jgi:uncharacterized membrane protein YedE/YeeE
MPLGIFDEKGPFNVASKLDSGAGTAFVDVITPPNRDMRFDAIYCYNTDAVDHAVQLGFQPIGTNYQFVTVNVPHGTELVENLPRDILAAWVNAAIGGLVVGMGNTLRIRVTVACTTGAVYYLAAGGFV